MSKNGDGTVALISARQPKLKSYFVAELHGNLANNSQVIRAVLDLLRSGRTHDLPAHWRARRGLIRRIDDKQLRMAGGAKIDWRRITAAQRDAILAELDSSRGVNREARLKLARAAARYARHFTYCPLRTRQNDLLRKALP